MPYSVSVVLPCYNGARWINKAIESVLSQTYKNFELLIIDDGSTDNSKEIISRYLSDPRVHYFYQENKGFSGAVNRGIMESRGDVIGFIGQDDLWMQNKLQVETDFLEKNPDVDLVHSNYCSIDEEEKIISIRKIKIRTYHSKKELIKSLFLGNFIGFETVLIKKKCFAEVGLLDERMVGFSDHDLWLRIAGKFHISYVDSVLVKKREHKKQISKNAIEKALSDEFLIAEKAIAMYPYLEKLLNKKLAQVYYGLGSVLLEKGSTEQAKEKLRKAIRCRTLKVKAIIAYVAPFLFLFVLKHLQKQGMLPQIWK